jgi:uncharacterized protein (DUF58 family)
MARIGFTTRASCLLAAGGTAVLAGLGLGIVDLARAGVLALAVPLLSALAILRSRVQITNRRRVEPRRTMAGGSVTVHLELSNRSRLACGAMMLEDELPVALHGSARFVVDGLQRRQSRTVSYRMPQLPRGRYQVGPLHLRLTDPFHLVDIRRSFSSAADIVVTPVIEPVDRPEPLRSADIGDDGGSTAIGTRGADDASTREYRVGDDLRKIHWRSSAKVGSLMVRQEERPWQGALTVLLDRRAGAHVESGRRPDDDSRDARRASSLEWAISAAATVGAAAIAGSGAVTLVDDPSRPAPVRLSDVADLGDHLATVGTVAARDLRAASSVFELLRRDATVVAILGALDATTLRLLADRSVGATPGAARALLLDVSTWAGTAPMSGSVADTARVLNSAGWHVVVGGRDDSVAAVARQLLEPRPRAAFAGALR